MKLKASVVWPLFVCGILFVSLSVCALTVYASLSDKSYAVETDYYERAVRWDESARERDASAALGWNSEITVVSDGKRGELRVILRDADGAPIADAAVRAEVFHHAHRRSAIETTLRSAGVGRYVGALQTAPSGLWQVRLRASTPDGMYVITRDVRSKDQDA